MQLLNLLLLATCLGLAVWVWQLRQKLASMDDLALSQHRQISDLATKNHELEMKLKARPYTIKMMEERGLLEDRLRFEILIDEGLKRQWLAYLQYETNGKQDYPISQFILDHYGWKENSLSDLSASAVNKSSSHV